METAIPCSEPSYLQICKMAQICEESKTVVGTDENNSEEEDQAQYLAELYAESAADMNDIDMRDIDD